MNTPVHIAEQQFGRLLVLGRAGTRTWFCFCDCGEITEVATSNLLSGKTKSCGCLRSEMVAAKNFKHGHSLLSSGAYRSWTAMWHRIRNFEEYSHLTVCERWLLFENFYRDMGDRPEGLTIERNNNDLGYEPTNCRWATRVEQRANQRPRRCSICDSLTHTANHCNVTHPGHSAQGTKKTEEEEAKETQDGKSED